MFLIRVKELFEPMFLPEKGDGFLFFKAFSWERRLWITIVDLTVNILYLTKNRLGRNELWCETESHNNMYHAHVLNRILDSNFN